MRSSIVPAQITSVEDKIAGDLSFTQLLLMIVPVFIGAAIFALLPPFITYSAYKVAIVGFITLVSLVLAIRIRGKLIAQWIGIKSRYNLRPRYYVLNKNDQYLRRIYAPVLAEDTVEQTELVPIHEMALRPALTAGDSINFNNVVTNPSSNFKFSTTRKGGLRVHIKEVQ